MKYLTITYAQKPNGQWDESVSVCKNLKPRDYSTANVIMDFRNREIVKCSMSHTTLPKDWQKIRDFYHGVYPQYIDQLEAVNPVEV